MKPVSNDENQGTLCSVSYHESIYKFHRLLHNSNTKWATANQFVIVTNQNFINKMFPEYHKHMDENDVHQFSSN